MQLVRYPADFTGRNPELPGQGNRHGTGYSIFRRSGKKTIFEQCILLVGKRVGFFHEKSDGKYPQQTRRFSLACSDVSGWAD